MLAGIIACATRMMKVASQRFMQAVMQAVAPTHLAGLLLRCQPCTDDLISARLLLCVALLERCVLLCQRCQRRVAACLVQYHGQLGQLLLLGLHISLQGASVEQCEARASPVS